MVCGDHLQLEDQLAFPLSVHIDERSARVDAWLRLAQALHRKLRVAFAAVPLEVVNGIFFDLEGVVWQFKRHRHIYSNRQTHLLAAAGLHFAAFARSLNHGVCLRCYEGRYIQAELLVIVLDLSGREAREGLAQRVRPQHWLGMRGSAPALALAQDQTRQ